jgi:hypothetical protein
VDEDARERFFRLLKRQRKYASAFERDGEKSVQEFDVGLELLKSLRMNFGLHWDRLQSNLEDPPDLFCWDAQQVLYGIELCEIVSEEAIEKIRGFFIREKASCRSILLFTFIGPMVCFARRLMKF